MRGVKTQNSKKKKAINASVITAYLCYLFYRLLQCGYRALGCWMIISTLFNSEIVMVNSYNSRLLNETLMKKRNHGGCKG